MNTKSFLSFLFCVSLILAMNACGGSPAPAYEEPEKPMAEEPVERPMAEEPLEEESMAEEPVAEEPMTEEPMEPAQPEPPIEESEPLENSETEFNPSNANQVPPDDVFNEVSYYGVGGRGSACEWETKPTLIVPYQTEWMNWILTETCGWQENEAVTVTVILPDSSQVSERVDAGLGYFIYDIEPTKSMQPGIYTIIVEGNSGYVEDSTEVIVPPSPRMYDVEGDWLVLYNFSSYENIRLFAYETISFDMMRLIGWDYYQTDSRGQLMIQTPGAQFAYITDGEISGVVSNSAYGSTMLDRDIYVSSCGGLPSRLSGDIEARVAFTDGSDMRIREEPSYSADILTTVPEGTFIQILINRKCEDNSTWWEIRTESGLEGWMAEDQDGVYLLEPYP